MKELHIQLPEHLQKYVIQIGSTIIDHITDYIDFEKYTSLMIVTDSNVAPIYLPKLVDALRKEVLKDHIHHVIMEPGETHKTLDTVHKIYEACGAAAIDRKSLIINLGGGVVSDVGGFAASTYLRGVSYINIPTTLESMVDASVGGKTGVNFSAYKNYIGTFAQPAHVFIDVDTLKTLPERALIQGYAEVIKHALIADKDFFKQVHKYNPKNMSENVLIDLIESSIKIKSQIVKQDEFEKGVRKILNFGHTVGHALETHSIGTSEPLFHGEAVAIGMVAETMISKNIGLLKEEVFEGIEKAISDAGLPTRYLKKVSIDELLSLISKDKKCEGGKTKWSLLESIGNAEFNVIVDEKFVRDALGYILHE